MHSTPEDSLSCYSSWSTYPPIEDNQACTCSYCSLDCVCLDPEGAFPYNNPEVSDSFYDSSGSEPSDTEETTVPGRASSLRPGVGCPTSPPAPEGCPSYDGCGSDSRTRTGDLMDTLPSSRTLPEMGYSQNASPSYHLGSTFSRPLRVLDGDLVSSPPPLARGLPPSLGELAAPTPVAGTPSFERLDTPQHPPDTWLPSHSGNGNGIPAMVSLRVACPLWFAYAYSAQCGV